MVSTVAVTLEDIRLGERCDPEKCPVALALCRTFPTLWADVGDEIRLRRLNTRSRRAAINVTSIDTPEEVCDFISKFDNGEVVSPFEFTIEIKESILKEDGQ